MLNAQSYHPAKTQTTTVAKNTRQQHALKEKPAKTEYARARLLLPRHRHHKHAQPDNAETDDRPAARDTTAKQTLTRPTPRNSAKKKPACQTLTATSTRTSQTKTPT